MRKTFLFFFLFIVLLLKAQEDPVKLKLRHIKGIKGVEAGYGITKFGNYYSLGYINFLDADYFLYPSLIYETSKIGVSEVREYSLSFSFQRTVYKVEDALYINVGVSPYAQIQTSRNDILDKQDLSIPVGVALDLNVEFYILNSLSLKAGISEVYSYNDKFGSFRYLAGGGLRFYFN